MLFTCRSFNAGHSLKMQQKLNLFSRHTIALQHRYFRKCFSSFGMYEEFLIVITQLNNVLLDVGCETTFEVSNQWVSRYTEWNFPLSFLRFRLQDWCQNQTSNHYWTIRVMSVYLIMGQYWQYYLSEPSSITFFLKLKLFSFCFRPCDNIINEANGCEHDIRSLRKLSICFFDTV